MDRTKMAVFWVVVYLLLITLMMEAARTSETLLNFYQTTWRYNPEDSHLCTHRCENFKSYMDRTVPQVYSMLWIFLCCQFIDII
jgi:hypothetical protein